MSVLARIDATPEKPGQAELPSAHSVKPEHGPRRRSGRQKSDEKRAAIRDAAAKLFLRRGVVGTSMDPVAREAGVSK